ncbi:sodium/glutamate symporter [Anaerococcus sp. ENR1011]|uniref:Sodium/glutamate symporter n=1 Tax=Anaerococcus groningensis TaxID=3115616 RepID=A0ABW9MZP0_9FIRM
MELELDMLQTLSVAVIVYLLGVFIRNKISLFRKYFIPAPVIGGIIFSVLSLIFTKYLNFTISLDTTLQDFFMNIFFTTVGFTVSVKILKQSGKQGLVLGIIAVILLVFQNLIGVGLTKVFNIHPQLGVAMGSTAMSGGVGSAVAFGPTFEANGALNATTIGTAAATFGLLMGSLVGGPVAKRLIDKYQLKSAYTNKEIKNDDVNKEIVTDNVKIFNSAISILIAAGIGTVVGKILNMTGVTFPYYVGCLFGGAIVRNLSDINLFEIRMKEIDMIGSVSLNLFLSLALMSLDLQALVSLALPMIVILLSQTIFMMLYASFVTFKAMGKDYEAAVMVAGHCGVGLGQTPNAIANMSAIINQNGPAPNAWFVLPVITVVLINLANPLIITFFINMFS